MQHPRLFSIQHNGLPVAGLTREQKFGKPCDSLDFQVLMGCVPGRYEKEAGDMKGGLLA